MAKISIQYFSCMLIIDVLYTYLSLYSLRSGDRCFD